MSFDLLILFDPSMKYFSNVKCIVIYLLNVCTVICNKTSNVHSFLYINSTGSLSIEPDWLF